MSLPIIAFKYETIEMEIEVQHYENVIPMHEGMDIAIVKVSL